MRSSDLGICAQCCSVELPLAIAPAILNRQCDCFHFVGHVMNLTLPRSASAYAAVRVMELDWA